MVALQDSHRTAEKPEYTGRREDDVYMALGPSAAQAGGSDGRDEVQYRRPGFDGGPRAGSNAR